MRNTETAADTPFLLPRETGFLCRLPQSLVKINENCLNLASWLLAFLSEYRVYEQKRHEDRCFVGF